MATRWPFISWVNFLSNIIIRTIFYTDKIYKLELDNKKTATLNVWIPPWNVDFGKYLLTFFITRNYSINSVFHSS